MPSIPARTWDLVAGMLELCQRSSWSLAELKSYLPAIIKNLRKFPHSLNLCPAQIAAFVVAGSGPCGWDELWLSIIAAGL